MPFYRAPERGYWKVKREELEEAQNYDGVEFPINGSGSRWKDGPGVVRIPKCSPEWDYIFNHIRNLQSFIDDSENTSSVCVPKALVKCFIRGIV